MSKHVLPGTGTDWMLVTTFGYREMSGLANTVASAVGETNKVKIFSTMSAEA